MLSETFILQQALERAGLTVARQHPRVKSPGRTTGPCLRIRLNGHGRVTAVEAVTDSEWPGLWTVMEGNQSSFPVVRIKNPLYDVQKSSAIWNELGFDKEGKRKRPPDKSTHLIVLAKIPKSVPALFPKKIKNDWKRLVGKASELIEHSDKGNKQHEALSEFAQRFQKAASDPQELLAEIAKCALSEVQQARLDVFDAVEILLVGKGPPDKDDKRPEMTVQLAFDLDGAPSLLKGLYSQQIKDYVKRVLPIDTSVDDNRRGSGDKHPAKACAFTGKDQPLQLAAFPKVKLPVLNKEFPLVSMFSEAECNKRYGLTDALIVPVAKEAALRMQDALTYIIAEERKGKTWRGVANGKFETFNGRKKELYDLLIVYVDGKPNIHARVADFFGTDEREQQKQFEVDAETICKALDGIERERPGSKLNLFLLRKVSEGQVQVAASESISVKGIIESATWWQKAAANVPPITLPLLVEKGKKAVLSQPQTPYPDQVVRLLAEEWVTNGTRSIKAYGIALNEVLDVLLRKSGAQESVVQPMLDLALRRIGPLLMGLHGATHSDDPKRLSDYPLRSRQIALRAVSLLGLLLAASDRWKEEYMNGPAFLLGKLLSLADTLHREYCKHVRDGNIPPQLIGNALMPVAADRPYDGLDRLRERMMSYKAWADKGNGEEYRLAKWAVGQMGQVCEQLSGGTLPTATDQTFRAELFLGYMARAS